MATLPALSGPEITYSAAAARFWCTDNSSMFGGGTSETGTQITIRTAGVFWEASFRVTQNNFGGSTLQFRKNTANGNEVMSVAASATGEFVDPVNNDLVVAGDKVCWQLTSVSTGSITVNATSQAYGPNSNSVGRLVSCSNGQNFTTASTTVYPHLDGQMATAAVPANAELQVPAAATTKNLFVNVTANARATASTVGSIKNGATGALTVSVTASTAGTFEDLTHSDTLAVNDLLGVFLTTLTGTSTLTITVISLEFVTTTGNGLVGGAHNGVAYNFGTTIYTEYGATVAGDTTEASCQQRCPYRVTFSLLWMRASANTVNGTSTYTFRKSGGAGNQTVSLGASTSGSANDPTNSDSISIGIEINFQLVTAGTSGTLTMQGFSQLVASGVPASAADGLAKASDQNAVTALLAVAADGAAKASDQNAATALLAVAATGAAKASGAAAATGNLAGAATGAAKASGAAAATGKQAAAATGAAKASGAAGAVAVLGITGLKPTPVGLADMGGYPFTAGAYPWGGGSAVSPYSGVSGSGDYSAAVLNVDIVVFWKDLQPTVGSPIDLSTVPTVTYIGTGEVNSGVAVGINAAQAIADAVAAGRAIHFRVIGGQYAPSDLYDYPCTDRAGVTAGGRSANLTDASGNKFPPFWTAKWDPLHPTAGFAGAYYDLQNRLSKLLDGNAAVRAVTFSGSLTQNTAEPLVRQISDPVMLAHAWWYGLGESTLNAGDDTDTPAVEALMKAHAACWRYTPMSFSLGPNRRPAVQTILSADITTFVGSSNIHSAGGLFTAAMEGLPVALDPTIAPQSTVGTGGTFFHFSNSTQGFLIDATGNPVVALANASGLTMGVFYPDSTVGAITVTGGYWTDNAVAQTIGAWASGQFGRMFIPGNTSFQANDYWLGNNAHTTWLMGQAYPFFLQGVVSAKLQNEVQRLTWSADGDATFLTISALGGSIVLKYAGQTSAAISLAGGTSASLVTNINAAIQSGALTTMKAEGVVASASGTNKILLSWPSPPAERADDLVVMDSSAVTGTAGLQGFVTVTQYEDTLVKDVAAAKLAGASWFEMHRGYESSTQPNATPAELLPYAGRVDPWQGAPAGAAVVTGTAGAIIVAVVQAAGAARASGTAGAALAAAAQASGAAKASGSATGQAILAALAAGSAIASGNAAASALLAGIAAGTAKASGAATGTALLAVSAAGQAVAAGTASQIATLVVAADGQAKTTGTATGTALLPAAAAGQALASGAATGTALAAGAADGHAVTTGAAAQAAVLVLAATGTALASGAAAATGTGALAAAGAALASGAAAGTALLAGVTAGQAVASGAATETALLAVAATGTALAGGSAAAAGLLRVLASGAVLGSGTAADTATLPAIAAGAALASGSAAQALLGAVAAAGGAIASGAAAETALPAAVAAGQARASGQAVATAQQTVAAAGTALASGAASASPTFTVAASGAAVASGTASATGALAGLAAGTAIAAGQAAATALLRLQAAGAAVAAGQAAGQALLAATAAGMALTSGQAATVQVTPVAAAGAAVTSAQAQAAALLAGIAAGTAKASGQAQTTALLPAVAAGAAVVSGTAIQIDFLPVAAAGTTRTSGTAADIALLAGVAAGTALAAGQATARAELVVAAAGQATSSGAATINPTLVVAADGTALTSGSAGAAELLAALAAGKAVTTGQAAALALLLVKADGQARTSGQAAQTALQPGAADGRAVVTGQAADTALQQLAADGRAVVTGQAGAGLLPASTAAAGQAVVTGRAATIAVASIAADGRAVVTGQAGAVAVLAVAADGRAVVTGQAGGLYLVSYDLLTVELTNPYLDVALTAGTLTVDLADPALPVALSPDTLTVDLDDPAITVPLGTGP